MGKSKQEQITDIATKRGFFFPSAEIYKAKAGFWTYGHLGTLMKHNWEKLWRNYFLNLAENYYEIEDVNILPEQVFHSSGHLKNFNDPLVECNSCKFRFKADELIEDKLNKKTEGLTEKEMEELIKKNKLKCPNCSKATLGSVRWFNMMFDVKVGALGNEVMYLRPETAQSPYLAFKRQFTSLREKLPMGLAVIGKAFRNEISPRQGFFRLREFTQAELQIFFDKDKIDESQEWNKIKDYKIRTFLVSDRKSSKVKERTLSQLNKLKIPKFYLQHLAEIQKFYLETLKIPKSNFRFRELSEKERAFYNKIHFDIEANLFKDLLNSECDFAYRDSFFKHNPGKYIIISITLNLTKEFKPVLEYKPLDSLQGKAGLTSKDVRDLVIATRLTKLPDWKKFPNTGSFFKNIIITKEEWDTLKMTYPDMPVHEVRGGYKVPTAWLIEHVADAKGLKVGDVGTWPNQPLVIVNYGNADAEEINEFASNIQKKVEEKTGIKLEREVVFVRS